MTDDKEEIEKKKRYTELLMRNQQIIKYVCWHYCNNDSQYFLDLYQEVALALWNEYRQYGLSRKRDGSKESAWVYGIAKNTSKIYRRKYGTAMKYTALNEEEMDALLVEEKQDIIEEQFDDLLSMLDETSRRIIDQHLQHLSYAKIAQNENLTVNAVRMRLHRITKLLKEKHNSH